MPQDKYDHLLTLVKNRRTIRKFKPDPLPEGSVEKIIEVARWAPSGFHTQPWEFVVVQKERGERRDCPGSRRACATQSRT